MEVEPVDGSNASVSVRALALRQRLQRDLNRAQDSDRLTRKSGLTHLHDILAQEHKTDPEATCMCFEAYVLGTVLPVVADATEKCRELSLKLLSLAMSTPLLNDMTYIAHNIVTTLVARVNDAPFLEVSEELRLVIISLITDVSQHPSTKPLLNQLNFLEPVLQALPRILSDNYPLVKAKAAQLVCFLAKHSSACTRMHAKGLVKALSANTSHQQSKVRQPTFKALGLCLWCVSDGFDELIKEFFLLPISRALFDRTASVRKESSKAVYSALKSRALSKSFPQGQERECVRFIFMFMADDEPQVAQCAFEQASKLGDLCNQARSIPHAPAIVPGEDGQADCAEVVLNLADTVASESAQLAGVNLELGEGGVRCLVQSTFKHVLPLLIADTRHWTLQTRVRSMSCVGLVCAECDNLPVFLPEILSCLCLSVCDEEMPVRAAAYKCAAVVTSNVDSNMLLDLLLPRVTSSIPGISSTQALTGALRVMFACVPSLNAEDVWLVQRICEALAEKDLMCSKDGMVREALLQCAAVVADHFSQDVWLGLALDSITVFHLTRAFLQLSSPINIHDEMPEAAAAVFERWTSAKLSRHAEAVVKIHIHMLLSNILADRDPNMVHWEPDDSDFQAFDTLVRTYGRLLLSLADVLRIWPLIEWHTNPNRAPELRLRAITSLEMMISQCCSANDLKDVLQQQSKTIIQRILIPNIVWRAGRVEATLRKVALAALYTMLKSSSLSGETLYATSPELFPLLKTNLDDHDASSRGLACWCLKSLLDMLVGVLGDEPALVMYPELLKRLDDGSDEVRKGVCVCMISFIRACAPGSLSNTSLEYMLDQLFVHLDDQDPSVQDAVQSVIVCVGSVAPNLVLSKAQAYRLSHRSPLRCDAIAASLTNSNSSPS